MKKRTIIIPLFLLSILALSLVAAQLPAFDPADASQKIVELITEFFSPLFAAFLGGEYLFEAILFLAVIISFVYVALKRLDFFYRNKVALWVITICVSILAARFTLDAQWTQFVLQPYNFLGVALLSVIPFIIFFYFLYSFDSPTVWSWGWSFFTIIYLAMWYTSFDKIGELSWIYLFVGILGFIVILSRKSIWGWRARQLIRRGLDESVTREMSRLQKQIDRDIELLNHTTSESRRRILQRAISKNEERLIRISKDLKI